jgi:hypothetical protein
MSLLKIILGATQKRPVRPTEVIPPSRWYDLRQVRRTDVETGPESNEDPHLGWVINSSYLVIAS